MAFVPVLRHDSFTRDDLPKIGIRKEQIGFFASFVSKANLHQFDRVGLAIDKDNFRIGFKFYNSNKSKNPHTYSLFYDNPSKKTMATNVVTMINKFKFIKKISELLHPLDRQFTVKQDIHDKNFWIAQLCPAFEDIASSEKDLRGLRGIYRYKRSDGQIVYIGRGNILSRLNSLDRQEWDFDVIEYSIIEDPAEQSRWESYWLNKFEEEQDGLPFYNRISGKDVNRISTKKGGEDKS